MQEKSHMNLSYKVFLCLSSRLFKTCVTSFCLLGIRPKFRPARFNEPVSLSLRPVRGYPAGRPYI